MDQRNLIHPLTAGDLVDSAVFLVQTARGPGGTEIRRMEVAAVEWESETEPLPGALPHPSTRVRITAVDQRSLATETFVVKASTPLLVTGISL